jgi:hypothetical protein
MEEMRRKIMRQTCGWEANGTFYGRLWLRSAKKILQGVLLVQSGGFVAEQWYVIVE